MNLRNNWQNPLDGIYSMKGVCVHRTHIHSRMRFEPKIPVFQGSKAVRTSDYVTNILHLNTSKYFPQYPVLRHPQSVLFPLADRPSLIPTQKSRLVDT
jgi:hypothetical protein